MHEFKDTERSPWKISLTIGDVIRVKSLSDNRFNLFDPDSKVDGKPLLEVLDNDYPTLWELLWLLIEPQAEAKNITADVFGSLMAGECLIAAKNAFFNEWRDFFRQLQQPTWEAALEKKMDYNAKALKAVLAKLDDPRMKAIDAKITAGMESILNKSVGNLEGSVDLTLARLLGDNSTSSPKENAAG